MRDALFVSFSGGRTSAYMCHWLLNNKADEYDFIFVFANTGAEVEGTLEFVDRCDKEWGLNLVWLEAKVNPVKGAEIEFKTVNFESASREGEPFYDVCAKHGVPNSDRPFCTQYLKTYVINAYKASLGHKRTHKTAIGIRADEADRMNFGQLERGEVLYPLIKFTHTAQSDVVLFFKDYHFDLNIRPNDGNCKFCFKMSKRHQMTRAKYNPEYFDLAIKIEREFGHIDAKEGDPRHMYRGNESANDIIASSREPFIEFNQEVTEFQLSFNIDPMDIADDCGANSCEAI